MDDCRCGMCVVPTIIGIIFGIIAAFATGIGLIINLLAIIWVAFGVALFAILLFVLISVFGERREEECLRKSGRCLVVGGVLTVLAAIVALVVINIATIILLPVVIGIGAFFFIFTLISLLQVLLCLANTNCRD